jgi:hypothetical protein
MMILEGGRLVAFFQKRLQNNVYTMIWISGLESVPEILLFVILFLAGLRIGCNPISVTNKVKTQMS